MEFYLFTPKREFRIPNWIVVVVLFFDLFGIAALFKLMV